MKPTDAWVESSFLVYGGTKEAAIAVEYGPHDPGHGEAPYPLLGFDYGRWRVLVAYDEPGLSTNAFATDDDAEQAYLSQFPREERIVRLVMGHGSYARQLDVHEQPFDGSSALLVHLDAIGGHGYLVLPRLRMEAS